ncbi:MAG: RNA methyltransferase [Polyangiaceae bacterium]|nr:RNA methyltransferase [Polyangiaceae bacterium]
MATDTPPEERLIVGLQPVREAIRVRGDQLHAVLVQTSTGANRERLDGVARFATDHGATVRRVPRSELESLSKGTSHQGCAAIAPPLALTDVEELLSKSRVIVAIDNIQDPQNFGAIIRSCVGLGADGVLWAENNSAPLSTATFRASAGAIEHATLCRVNSLRGALQDAQGRGFVTVGLDASASGSLRDAPLGDRVVVVVGSEHTGLERAVRRACSHLARLTTAKTIDSLNASVAAALAIYECQIQQSSSDT